MIYDATYVDTYVCKCVHTTTYVCMYVLNLEEFIYDFP